MTTDSRHEVTRLLEEVAAGQDEAKEQLLRRVYDELKGIARRLMAGERRDISFGATDLVHEGYLRLFAGDVPAKSRAYFFGSAVRAMRRLLIEHARQRKAHPPPQCLPLDDSLTMLQHTVGVDIEALDEALLDFEGFAPREHEVVMLRVFGGLSVKEASAHLGVSVATVEKDWTWAKAWLFNRLRDARYDDRALARGKGHFRGRGGAVPQRPAGVPGPDVRE